MNHTIQLMKNLSKIYKLNKSLFHNVLLESSGTDAEPKDIKRILDMLSKAGSDISKLSGLANKMCNAITDKNKMLRRYNAALLICSPDSVVIEIFKEGCARLGVNVITDTEETTNNTNVNVVDLNEPNTSDEEVIVFDSEDIKDAAEEYNSQQTSEADEINLDQPWKKLKTNPLKVLTLIQDKLSEYNIGINAQYHQNNLNNILNEWAQQSKRYGNKLKNIQVSLKNIMSLMSINIQIEFRWKFKGDTIDYPYKLSLINFNIIKDYWDIDKAVIEKYQSSYPGSSYNMYYNRCYSDKHNLMDLMPLLKSVGLVIMEYIQKQDDFSEYVLKANEFYNKILHNNNSDTNVLFYSHTKEQNTMMNKVKDKIIDMICEKFDVENYPSKKWPGFAITYITQSKVTFNIHSACKSDARQRDYITNLTPSEKYKILQNFFKNILRIKAKDMDVSPYGAITVDLLHLINVLK